MLDDKKIEAINYLAEGLKSREEIASIIGVAERTLYRWMQGEEFKAERQKRALEFQKGLVGDSNAVLTKELGKAIKNVVEIANSRSIKEETRLKANQYLIDRVLGNTTTKIEQSNTDSTGKNTDVNIEDMLNEIKEDNVITLPKDKVK